MDFGRHTNAEILNLIASGQVSYGDTVYSTDWNEILVYNGTVFASQCSCHEIGSYPPCGTGNCASIVEAYVSFDEDYEPPGF
jgi:hypothetical protein